MSAENEPRPRPAAPVNHLVLEGEPLPCYVKAAVYQAGQAAGLGIRTTAPALMQTLQRALGVPQMRQMLRLQVEAEFTRQGITYGLQEDAVQATIDEFIQNVESGAGAMVTRKVAEGQLPEAGQDGWLAYPLNPDALPLRALGRAARIRATQTVHRVGKGDVLVERHPPEGGTSGTTVRGESVEFSSQPRDVALGPVAGANTTVAGQKIVAAIQGVYREDIRGQVRVVQELMVEEVNAGTGDLPKAGVAGINLWVRQVVRRGFGVFTTEDVLVGDGPGTGTLEEATRIRAGNLLVGGQVAGRPLPEAYLSGEMDSLEEAEQHRLRSQLEKSQVEVEGLFGAREVLNGNVSADTILVQTHSYHSGLHAEQDVWVDGNLCGGIVSFGRRLQVLGDLGNDEGSATRIRLGVESRETQQKARLRAEIQERKIALEIGTEKLEAHQDRMEQRAKKDAYWAALFKEEPRPPRGPFESRILAQYFQAAKEKKRLQQEEADGKQGIRDLERLLQELEEEGSEEGSALQVVVGGTVYPGVFVELILPLSADDLEQPVYRRTEKGSSDRLQEIKSALAKRVSDYLASRQEGVEERKQALDQMFKGQEKRPPPPTIPNKRFQVELVFPETEAEGMATGEATEGETLSMEGILYVYAGDPQTFYLKRRGKIKEPSKGVVLSLEKSDRGFVFRQAPNKDRLTSWQKDTEVTEKLDAVQVMGRSARKLLLKSRDP